MATCPTTPVCRNSYNIVWADMAHVATYPITANLMTTMAITTNSTRANCQRLSCKIAARILLAWKMMRSSCNSRCQIDFMRCTHVACRRRQESRHGNLCLQQEFRTKNPSKRQQAASKAAPLADFRRVAIEDSATG